MLAQDDKVSLSFIDESQLKFKSQADSRKFESQADSRKFKSQADSRKFKSQADPRILDLKQNINSGFCPRQSDLPAEVAACHGTRVKKDT